MNSTSPLYLEALTKKTIDQNNIGCMGWEQDVYLPEAESQMFASNPDTSADLAIALLTHYSFDLGGYSASELVGLWQKQYPGNWLHMAVIEALYQGRYKAVSVQQILTCWQRRGQAIFHFNMEFERLICSKFPQSLTTLPEMSSSFVETTIQEDTSVQTFPAPVPSTVDTGTFNWLPLKKVSVNNQTSEHADTEKSPRHPILSQQQSYQRREPETPSPPSPNQNDQDNFLPGATNNPPIEQFTPQTSAGSESFTSKLKAISNDKLHPSEKLIARRPQGFLSQEIGND
jgi:hypothetical protein